MKRLFKIFVFMVTLFIPITAHAETTSITSTFDISLPATIDLQKVGDSYAYVTEVGVKGELPDNSFINVEINDNVKLYDVTNRNEENALEDQSTYVHKEPVDVQMGLSNDIWESVDLDVNEYNYAQLSATACDISAGSWEGSCTFTITYVEQVALTLAEEEQVLVTEEEDKELPVEEKEEVSESEPIIEEEEDLIVEVQEEESTTENEEEQDLTIENEEEQESTIDMEGEQDVTEEIIGSEPIVEEPELIIEENNEVEEPETAIETEEGQEITMAEEELESEVIIEDQELETGLENTEELELDLSTNEELIINTIDVEEVM